MTTVLYHQHAKTINGPAEFLPPVTIGGRELLSVSPASELNCVRPAIEEFPDDVFTQEQRLQGGVVLHFILTAYLCATLGYICEAYFVPSLELISEVLKVPSDVAGATFMAIGTSAPELFSSVIGAFLTEGDIGVGAIVGSAVFNVIGVTGIAGLAVWNESVSIDWYPISRDCLAYTLSIIALIVILIDNTVTWYEAVILLVMFVGYILMMVFNSRLQDFSLDKMEKVKSAIRNRRSSEKTPLLWHHPSSLKKVEYDKNQNKKLIPVCPDPTMKEVEKYSVWRFPEQGCLRRIAWVLMWPSAFLLFVTIPDCRQERFRRFFLFTFSLSVMWIAALTYISVWMVTLIGFTFGIPDSIAGLTILAVGTSVPEIMSSVIVVREGLGNMAICNLIGSNVFNIVFCLGAPWLIKTLLSPTGSIQINSAAMTYNTLTLLSTVVVLYLFFTATKWKLNKNLGFVCVVMYIVFVFLACYYELELLSGQTLPPCVTYK